MTAGVLFGRRKGVLLGSRREAAVVKAKERTVSRTCRERLLDDEEVRCWRERERREGKKRDETAKIYKIQGPAKKGGRDAESEREREKKKGVPGTGA